MVRILHSVSNMDRAGIETMLMNYYRHMDRSKVQFDFLCNKNTPGAYDQEIRSMGGRIFHTPGLNPLTYGSYLNYMTELFRSHPEYRILEAHNDALAVYALNAAKRCQIPIRIFHAHGTQIAWDWKYPLKRVCKELLPGSLTHRFACSHAAARFYFSSDGEKVRDYEVVPNAIETQRFLFDSSTRERLRAHYGLTDKTVIGHVGRFMHQKNHLFLLDVFAAYLNRNSKAHLVLLGDGELMPFVIKKAHKLGISHAVTLIGNVSNVNDWYQVFDCFLLPSVWEGLPLVAIEAQCADLPCVLSDSITDEVVISPNVQFMSLTDQPSLWAKAIDRALRSARQENVYANAVRSGFDIQTAASALQERYLKLAEECEMSSL